MQSSGGLLKSVSAVIAKLDTGENTRAETAEPAQGKWGLAIADLDSQTARQLGIKDHHGVPVVGVQPGSPAQMASVQENDVILELNRQSVESAKDFKDKAAGAGDSLLLLVKNDQGQRYLVVSR